MRRATRSERRLLAIAQKRWRGFRLPDGIARKQRVRPEMFDRDQLAIGIGVEREHTNRPELAMEIAMAHLTERPDYYQLLEKMERTPRRSTRRSAKRDPSNLTIAELRPGDYFRVSTRRLRTSGTITRILRSNIEYEVRYNPGGLAKDRIFTLRLPKTDFAGADVVRNGVRLKVGG